MNSKVVFLNFLWSFSEKIVAQLVSFVVSIIIARILLPEDYGIISIVMVFITFANILVTNSFSSALIQKKDTDDLDYSSVFYFSVILSIFLYLIVFIISPLISKWYGMPVLTPVLRVLGIRIILASINSVQSSYVSKNLLFKKLFKANIIGIIISAIIGIVMAYYNFGVWALVAQYLSCSIINTIAMWIEIKWRPKKIFSFNRLKTLISYGWKLLASALVGTLYDDLRTLIIGKMYSSNDLAYYTRGQQFPKLIMTNVNSSFSTVLFPVFSSIQDEKNKLEIGHRKSIQVSSGIISPLMLGLAAIATPVVKLLLTDKWLPCVPFLQICCLFYLITSLYTLNLQMFKAVGRSGLSLSMELIDNLLGLLLIALFYKKGVLVIAWITLLTRLIAYFTSLIFTKKILNVNYFSQIKDIFTPIVLSLIMYIIVKSVDYLSLNYVVILVIQILLGFIVYILLSIIFKLPYLNIIMSFIKKNIKKIK